MTKIKKNLRLERELILFLFAGAISFYTDPDMNIQINEYTKKTYGKESDEMLYSDDYGYWCRVCRKERYPANY